MTRRIGIAAAIWAAGTLLSRVIGLGREAAFGRIVGGGEEAGVYQAAFLLPNFLNYLLAAGALSIVFIPLFAAHLTRNDEEQAWRAFSVISTAVGGALLVLTTGLMFAIPTVNHWWFSGLSADALTQLDAMTRVLLPAQIFHVLGGLLSAALQARDRHALPAMTSVVYNACIISGGLIAGPEYGAWGFVWGVLVGSVLGPFGLPLYGCLRMGLRYRPMLAWTEDLKSYLWQSLPIMLAFSVVVVDDWLLTGNADDLGEGAIATVMYAKSLLRVPMGVFGLALGAAAYPTLARLIAEGRKDDAYTTMATSVKQMLVLALGAQVVLTVAGAEIAAVIYGPRLLAGQHEAIGVALGIMGLGLWAWAAQTVLSRGFYALGQTWVPSVLGTAVVAVTWPFYGLLGGWFGTAGLAIASSTAISVYVLALGIALRRAYPGARGGFLAFGVRAVPAVLIGLAAGLGLRAVWLVYMPDGLPPIQALDGEIGPLLAALLQGGVLATVGGAAYLAVALGLDLPGARPVLGAIRRRVLRRS